MIYYIETSILLSIILGDHFNDKAVSIWNAQSEKVSSILTLIEATIVLRRFFKANKKNLSSHWLSKQEKQLKELLSECSLMKIDENIQSIIELKKDIADCRSLDGIHVATAIFLKDVMHSSNFAFYSFDNRVNEVAAKFGLRPGVA
ncbi:PIN domain-containing protein [Leptospira meyeri]|uniref:PIN domain-containing protein n=1 Tax=Leptospira meyeri TaxID=29508 RepID=A0A4R8MQ25_LEPME|nr:PIN domain-containing protein [Leptospira meyeri]EKJ85762.1 PIN domain protein [Leptospira meyeri serovar Hardjo str. Went 5]EMJ87557.1 PIN domain protein [Leptospira meyeri serovar Semaranga str. Veldrot Semarang 173]TDY68432.1 PIN domain-containing protein [Leptospira meyeri]TGL48604.1 PIN domain-containing protein [Leptospira meyeri]